ncbi:MAG: efflux RND transporter periplasmic adaptor subunit [Deltaproteobacteria bacterium]|nr:efflux RND transporter periplasmic adaptor subunit [Deltaproteobacteria bacterium]
MSRPIASSWSARAARLPAFLLGAALAACSSPAAAPVDNSRAAVAVHAEPARLATLTVGEEIVGTVRARDTAEIAPTVMGPIVDLRCALGSEVKAGQPIARIAVRELAARLSSARAALAQAELERGRTTRLLAGGAITGAERDAAETRHQIATAGVAEAEAMADHAIVRAPFTGVVTAKLASTGDVAMPGRPLCAIQDPGALRFEAIVPETLAGAFAKVRAVPVLIASLDAPLAATVVEVSPSADPVSRTVLVKLALPADPRVRAGAFGRATVPAREVRAVTAPAAAIVRHGELEAVFVITGSTARMRLIKTGRTIDGQVEILAGLTAGEVVVTAPGALLDGQAVAVTP